MVQPSPMVVVNILGPFETVVSGERVKLGGALQRCLLAVLAAHHGRAVTTDELSMSLWGNELPSTFRLQLYKRVHGLRDLLGPSVIETGETGYLLNPATTTTDARCFADDVAAARALRRVDRVAEAADAYRYALGRWRGGVFDGLVCGGVRDAVARLDELRARAIEECCDTEFLLGRGADRTAEMMTLALQFSNRERVVGYLMSSLRRSGRHSAALELFQQLRTRLLEDTGSEPSESVLLLGKSIRDEFSAGASGVAGEPDEMRPRPVPSFLPADMRTFVGRESAMADLNRLVDESAGVTAVALVTGGAGVGKTAFAVHWAHQASDRFPDGQLFIDLRGFAPEPAITADDALVQLLRTLGADARDIPEEETGRIALYRSLLVGRRMLIVLDNAATERQVRLLLPGSSGCAVVVTSRNDLRGLVALDDAHRIVLDQLSEDEALALISRMLGEARAAEEPDAVRALARVCGYLPLAVRVATANIAGNRERVSAAVTRLESADRLGQLKIRGEPVVAAAFELSCRALPAPAARLFDLIGLLPRPEFTARTAEALTGESRATTMSALGSLEDMSLVTPTPRGRYQVHDLLYLHARDRLSPRDRLTAQRRLLEYYLHTADRAADLLMPAIAHQPRGATDVEPSGFATPDAAVRWLDDESECIATSVQRCAAEGPPGYAWQLADVLYRYLWLAGRTELGRRTVEAGLRSAMKEVDVLGQAVMHGALGALSFGLGSTRGDEHLRQSLELFTRLGNQVGRFTALVNLGSNAAAHGRPLDAVDLLEEALELAGAPDQRAHVLEVLSKALRDVGRLHDAVRRHEEARQLVGAASSGPGLSVRVALAASEAVLETGDLSHADDVRRELLSFVSSDVVHWRMAALGSLAAWDRAIGDARGVLAHAATLAETAGDHSGRRIYALMAAILRGEALAHLGRTEEAVSVLERGFTTADGAAHPHLTTRLTIALGRALMTLGDREAAAHLVALALDTAREHGFAVLEGRALTTLAVLRADRSLAEHARSSLTPTGHLLAVAESLLVLGSPDAEAIFARYTGVRGHVPVGVLGPVELGLAPPGCDHCT